MIDIYLQGHFLAVRCCRVSQFWCSYGSSSERNNWHIRVFYNWFSGALTISKNKINNTGRQSCKEFFLNLFLNAKSTFIYQLFYQRHQTALHKGLTLTVYKILLVFLTWIGLVEWNENAQFKSKIRPTSSILLKLSFGAR